MNKRDDFLTSVQRLEGRPYLWGRKGPEVFDCSGVVTYCLHKVGGPDWRAYHNCQKLEADLPMVTVPKPGDLVLYGKRGRASHVMVVIGDGRVFGACGGDSSTLTLEEAEARGARVKYRANVHYRKDFIGYRSLAEFLEVERAP